MFHDYPILNTINRPNALANLFSHVSSNEIHLNLT